MRVVFGQKACSAAHETRGTNMIKTNSDNGQRVLMLARKQKTRTITLPSMISLLI